MQSWADNLLLVDLSREPDLELDLETILDTVLESGQCDVVMDFSEVDIIHSTSLATLVRIQKLLRDCAHSLVLCSVAPATKGIFEVTELAELFDIREDRFAALATVGSLP